MGSKSDNQIAHELHVLSNGDITSDLNIDKGFTAEICFKNVAEFFARDKEQKVAFQKCSTKAVSFLKDWSACLDLFNKGMLSSSDSTTLNIMGSNF